MDIKVKTSMEDWSGKVDLKERQIEGLLKPNVEQLLLAYNMIKEYFKEVERKERGLKQQAKDLESKEREVALKVDELKLTETRVKKRLNKVQLKEKHFDSLEKSLKADKQHLGSLLKSTEECKRDLASISHQLQMKERELAQQAKELELKQKQFSSQAKTKHLEPAPADNNSTVPSSTIDHSCININIDVTSNKEEPESSPTRNAANLQPNTTRDDRNVPGLLNENFSCNHSVQSDLAAYLRSVPDPAKVVLNSMRNSIRPYLRKGYFEESVISRNIFLLKELMIVSPHVGSHMKENARYLATQWKIKMRGNTENSVESLAYFLFITMYELDFMLNGDEIVKLLLVISQTIMALELCQTHGFAAKMIGIIWNLIERGRLIEAVRFICSFKLTEKLPPVPLLKEYVEDAKKFCEIFCEKKISLDLTAEFVDNKIGGLKAVQQCIKDYNLECEYPAADIQMQVVQLERMKEKWRSPAPYLGSNVKQKGQRKTKRPNSSSSTPESQPQQQK